MEDRNNSTIADKQNGIYITYWILLIIIGTAAFKQIDFENLTVKNPGITTVYTLTLILLIFFIVKSKKLNRK